MELPALTRLVRRGRASRIDVAQPGWRPHHLRLLSLLGLDADRLHGGAPVEWLGLGGEPRRGGWLQAAFVHLEIGSHNARLHAVTGLGVQEALQLATVLAAGLQFPGFSVLPSPDLQQFPGVFLHSDGPIDAVCPVPGSDDLVELRDVLPQGKDGPVLRRLLTEAQMLLHDHPVNAGRERRNLRAVNAVWLTGVGEFDAMLASSLPGVASDGAYLKGLCRLHGGATLPVSASAEALLSAARPALVELPAFEDPDPSARLHQLEHDWFAPLANAIGAGRIVAAELHLDEVRVQIDRPALRRFWRRGPTLADVLQ